MFRKSLNKIGWYWFMMQTVYVVLLCSISMLVFTRSVIVYWLYEANIVREDGCWWVISWNNRAWNDICQHWLWEWRQMDFAKNVRYYKLPVIYGFLSL